MARGFLVTFLLAAIVFGAVERLANTSPNPGQTTETKGADESDNKDANRQPHESTWDWVTHDAAGFFTLWLVVIGGAQLALFWVQLHLIRESLVDARQAADAATKGAEAARLNAQAVIDAERGRPFVSIEAHNLQEMVASAAQLPQHDDYTTSALRIKYTFKNYGRTPVIIKEVGHHFLMQITPLSPILEERGYERLISLPIEHIISPGDKSGPIVCQLDQRFTIADAKSVARVDNTLWFCGYISYDDTFGFGRELHFIWHYNGASGGLRLYSYREIQSQTKH